MIRRVPLLPTLVVAAAVALMIGLGVWQLQRAEWKAALLANYRQAQTLSASVPWPRSREAMEHSLFRWSELSCDRVLSQRVTAARSALGENGVAQIFRCAIGGGGQAEVALGWSQPTAQVNWAGGKVSGVIAPGGEFHGILQAGSPPEALQQLAPPDPADVPNNHLAYAGQWFFFALTALVIYILALRKRWLTR
ncbi:MAG TPA: SURF1 family cytochrome oxidase biogenesis protein [Croceibacterium sp.]|nr:SURF1 family cytochrome oxidase biogenesis protein [Croceibacterium sp.]